jgi:sugar/nucleoside kinase (ribokinase family)
VITDYVRIEAGKKTNYHYFLWYDVDRTILIKHEAFSYSLGDITPPQWIYLSSLGSNTLAFHDDIANFIETHPETKLAFQPGTFQIKTGKDRLVRLYRESDIFFCNVEEAQKILDESSRDPKTLLAKMHDLGPAIVCITDGINGAYAFDGTEYLFMPVYPHNPFERTGAGDAFASTVVSALALGKPLREALTWGPVNSQSVVQYIGAQKGLLPREKLEDLLTHAPEGYKIAEI